MVAAQKAAAAAFIPSSPAEPVEPVIDDRETRTPKAITGVRQLESQLIEDEPVEPELRVGSNWRALAGADEPFASNVVRPSRPARHPGT
jgi:hypothetical protein